MRFRGLEQLQLLQRTEAHSGLQLHLRDPTTCGLFSNGHTHGNIHRNSYRRTHIYTSKMGWKKSLLPNLYLPYLVSAEAGG